MLRHLRKIITVYSENQCIFIEYRYFRIWLQFTRSKGTVKLR